MPHFFLMNESEMPEADALQLRARLHIRSFWTLMQHGKFAHGISILYDAFENAVHRFSLIHAPDISAGLRTRSTQAYKYLAQNGFVANDFDVDSFNNLVERALKDNFDAMNPDFDFKRLWADIENVFRELEILPFDFNSLPEENEPTRKVLGLQ